MKNILVFALLLSMKMAAAQQKPIKVIAYYTGNAATLEQYNLNQVDQVIFSFMHLMGDTLGFNDPKRATRLKEITALKKQYPHLSVLVSLGGWGGCKTCSEVFSSEEKRRIFAGSVLRICNNFDADGIDLDWEYPGIPGYPDHQWKQEDVPNFTALIQALRDSLGWKRQVSFAAGGFTKFLEESVEWEKVMPLVDRVNLMTYDLVSGFSKVTGHHTPLYSHGATTESTNHCVQWLIGKGISRKKLVIGGAFYARVWKDVPAINNGLYQTGVFERGVPFKIQEAYFDAGKGWQMHWDNEVKAPYAFNPTTGQFATFDDRQSLALKTRYAIDNQLGGIMFWQLGEDTIQNGLLKAIHEEAIR